MQVRFAAMLVDADHATLEYWEHVLNRVGVDNDALFTVGVLTSRVLDGAMTTVLVARLGVEAAFVGLED